MPESRNTFRAQRVERSRAVRADVDLDEVRRPARRSTAAPAATTPSASRRRRADRRRRAADVPLERVDARGRDDPRLAHRAAEDACCGGLDHALQPQRPARRAAASLREAEHDRVEVATISSRTFCATAAFRRARPRRGGGAGRLAAGRRDRGVFLERPDPCAEELCVYLEGHDPRRRNTCMSLRSRTEALICWAEGGRGSRRPRVEPVRRPGSQLVDQDVQLSLGRAPRRGARIRSAIWFAIVADRDDSLLLAERLGAATLELSTWVSRASVRRRRPPRNRRATSAASAG